LKVVEGFEHPPRQPGQVEPLVWLDRVGHHSSQLVLTESLIWSEVLGLPLRQLVLVAGAEPLWLVERFGLEPLPQGKDMLGDDLQL
jgi:hypothetical protein